MNAVLTPFAESMQAAAGALQLPASGLAWVDAARQGALQAFLERGLPDTHNELWKYTTLRALQQHRYAAGDPGAAARTVAPELLALDAVDGPRVVLVNGVFRADLSDLSSLPDGVTVRSLAAVLREAPEPLRFILDKRKDDEDDGFTLLNRALAEDGVLVRVASDVHLAAPLHLVHVGIAGDSAAALNVRSLFELGDGAEVRLVEHYVGDAKTGHLVNCVRDFDVHAHAHLDWTLIQRAGADTTLFRRSKLRLHDAADVRLHALELGAKLARHEVRVDLAGKGSRFDSHGAFVVHGRQHADTEVLVTHRGRDTQSTAVWRGVADNRAHGVVHGRILVKPGADGADGSFYNKNLLLSPDAEIITRPALEIYADEVKANHGATVGQLDEVSLFYLRSRGIPMDLARRMLVRAFCSEALNGIEPAPLREFAENLLAQHLPEAEA